jgi:hypothetical protein
MNDPINGRIQGCLEFAHSVTFTQDKKGSSDFDEETYTKV